MKIHFVLNNICFSLILYIHGSVGIDSDLSNSSNKYLDSMQIIRKYGYPAEAHIVQTADGYLLEMHRIPYGLNSILGKRRPILLVHGLLGSSADYVMLGANQSIGFLLADLGYDVWLGNVRGNAYSTAHVSLNPDQKEFWNFSFHESGIYDLPAKIDYIRNYTKQEKIIYVGFSFGSTMFFVLTSMLPEYNNRVELALLLAPVAYAKNIRSPLVRLVEPFSNAIQVLGDVVTDGSLLSQKGILSEVIRRICSYSNLAGKLCKELLFQTFGADPSEFNECRYQIFIGHYFLGYSLKAVNHFFQLMQSGKFRQYDYGTIGNELKYGSTTPPDYKLENIRVPIYIYQGKNDYVSTIPDTNELSKRLSTLRGVRVSNYSKFNHLDFLLGEHTREYILERFLQDLESHRKQTL